MHAGLLTAVKEPYGPSGVRDTGVDALRSLQVAARINQAIHGQSAELDRPETTFNHE